jgi:phosphomannomutase/phosphoglucomutase
MPLEINSSIFREYDIRGIADTDLNDLLVEGVAKAYGTLMKREGRKTVSLGYDMRLSSLRIQKVFQKSLLSTGLDVINIGMVTTPMLYFSIAYWKLDGGVMITGSHNPSEYNGLKLCRGTGSVYGKELQAVLEMIQKKDFETGQGAAQERSVTQDYKNYLKNQFQFSRKIKVVVDSGNGMGGLVSPELFRELGLEVIDLFSKPDGNFPNHHPDPSQPKNLIALTQKVKEIRADIGIAFDGDGDRIGVVDEKGDAIWGDKLLILYSRAILKKLPGATFIADVKCSQTLYDDIKKNGGKGVMWKTGHAIIKSKIKELNAALAGELSGHMFFNDRYFGFDDALYAACRVLEILDQAGDKKMSELLRDVPPMYSTPELHMDTTDTKKFQIVSRAKEFFKSSYDVIDIDGVRITFPDGWGLVRASNTQPVLVLRFEAATPKRVQEIQNLVESKVRELIATI